MPWLLLILVPAFLSSYALVAWAFKVLRREVDQELENLVSDLYANDNLKLPEVRLKRPQSVG